MQSLLQGAKTSGIKIWAQPKTSRRCAPKDEDYDDDDGWPKSVAFVVRIGFNFCFILFVVQFAKSHQARSIAQHPVLAVRYLGPFACSLLHRKGVEK